MAKKTRTPLSNVQLQKACHDISYEMWMLMSLADLLDEEQRVWQMNATYPTEPKIDRTYDMRHTSPPPRVYIYSLSKTPSTIILDDQESTKHNSLVESFGIHARAMIDFFYHEGHSIRDTDVIADDYFPNDQWADTLRPHKDVAEIQRLRDRVGAEIVHLTIRRQGVTLPDKIWQTRNIAEQLFEVFQVFKNSVSPELRSEIWR